LQLRGPGSPEHLDKTPRVFADLQNLQRVGPEERNPCVTSCLSQKISGVTSIITNRMTHC